MTPTGDPPDARGESIGRDCADGGYGARRPRSPHELGGEQSRSNGGGKVRPAKARSGTNLGHSGQRPDGKEFDGEENARPRRHQAGVG